MTDELERRLRTSLSGAALLSAPDSLHAALDRLPDDAGPIGTAGRDLRLPWAMPVLVVIVVLALIAAWLPGGFLGPAGPTASSTSQLSSGPSTTPKPSAAEIKVTVPLGSGHSMVLTIDDESGQLRAVRAATTTELDNPSHPLDDVVAYNPGGAPEAQVLLQWDGVICDTTAWLVIGPDAHAWTLEDGPAPPCDLSNAPGAVVLTFAQPIDASTVVVTRESAVSTPSSLVPTPVDDGGTFGTSGLWSTSGDHLYISSDQGATWKSSDLVAGVALSASDGNDLSDVFVLDATHAWTASPGPGSTPYSGNGQPWDKLFVKVSRTSDGGRTWKSVTLPGDWGGTRPIMAFADANHGYVLLAFLRGGGPGAVFTTDDGGATWRQVGGPDSLGSVFGVTADGAIWAGNQGDAGPVSRPVLDVSRDGGATWSDARLPGLVGDIYVNDSLVAPPIVVGQEGAVAVLAGSSSVPPAIRLFRTTDGDRTWVAAGVVPQNQYGSVSAAMVDATHYVVIDPAAGQVRHSADGGLTWQVSPMVGFGPAAVLHFWDPDHGVAIVQVSNGAAPAAALMTTSDGGQAWVPVTIPGR